MLHDLKNQMEVKQSIGASINASTSGTADGAWVDCGNIVNATTLLLNCKAAAGTLTAGAVTVEESDDSGGSGGAAIAGATLTAALSSQMVTFQRSKRYCRARIAATTGTATAVIADGSFLGQKRTVTLV